MFSCSPFDAVREGFCNTSIDITGWLTIVLQGQALREVEVTDCIE